MGALAASMGIADAITVDAAAGALVGGAIAGAATAVSGFSSAGTAGITAAGRVSAATISLSGGDTVRATTAAGADITIVGCSGEELFKSGGTSIVATATCRPGFNRPWRTFEYPVFSATMRDSGSMARAWA